MFSNKGKQVNRSWVYRKLNELCKQAGIDKKIGTQTHILRRSRATHLLNKGITLEQVSKWLRHKNYATTSVYLKISTADLQRRLEAVGDPLDDILRSVV